MDVMEQVKGKRGDIYKDEEEDEERNSKIICGVCTRQHFNILCVSLGLVLMVVIITLVSVILTRSSDSGLFIRIFNIMIYS